MMKRTGTPWMSADDYGRQLTGFVINLLVADMHASIEFQRNILLADVVYADEDFAAFRGYGSQWMLHTDHTYSDHPMSGVIQGVNGRGAGVELRLLGLQPDTAEAAAKHHDYIVLQGAMDKPHGLREVFILDPDGYVWVPSIALPK